MTTASDTERLAWLRLYRSDRIGPVTFRQLINRYGNAERAIEALPMLANRAGAKKRFKIADAAVIEREYETLSAAGAQLVLACEDCFSPLLKTVVDAPPLLTVKGRIECLNKPSVAIVGARNASAGGRRIAQQLAAHLGQHGYTIVSGLARGIDTAAHQASLDSGTIAVVAGGLNVIYPPENETLWHGISEKGLIVAEMPWDSQPTARSFPHRNRIISGLSHGLVVAEAARRSGSLISARLAGEQGREVFAVPGSPLDPRAEGTNDLLQQGAHLVTQALDIVDVLGGFSQIPTTPGLSLFDDSNQKETIAYDDVEHIREDIWKLLGPTPCPVDELAQQCQVSVHLVHAAIVELELAGRAETHPGQGVSRCYA